MLRNLDETDLRILRALQRDPRLAVSRIARQVGLTDNAVRYRLRRMQAAGIIRGFAVLVDPRVGGRPNLGVLLLRLAEGTELKALVEGDSDVVRAFRTSGEYNACLLACTADDEALARLAADLQARRGVERVVALPVLETVRTVTPSEAFQP